MSDKEKYGGKVWFVRGVPAELRAEVATAAERAGMKVGPWVERALRAALERPEGQGGVPAGQGGAGDLEERVADLAATVETVRTLFEKHRRQDFPSVVERLERLEALQVPSAIPGLPSGDRVEGRVPAAIPGRLGSPLDAVEPAEWVEVPETIETHPGASGAGRQKSPLPWTDADWTELRRIFDRGGNEADACRELGRGSSVISGKWATLLEERARRTLPSIEKVRQVDEMQKAGRSTDEILESLAHPKVAETSPKEPDQTSS
jgi:hypothetical protein